MHCRNYMYKKLPLNKIQQWNIACIECFLLEVLEEGEERLLLS